MHTAEELVYIKELRSKSVRNFTTRSDAYDYLYDEVFCNENFISNVSETAKSNKVSYLLAYDLITNYLTDVFYEIDKKMNHRTKKTRISILGYFFLDLGFAISFIKKKVFLINKLK